MATISPVDAQPVAGVLVSRDLFFASKVTGLAAAQGHRIVMDGDATQAARHAAAGCRCVIVDLSTPGLSLAELVASLPVEPRPRVIAYDAHVNEQRLSEARAAGCDAVYTRGQFSGALPAILRECLGTGTAVPQDRKPQAD
jgi:DNA-binding NarL/FixJ family response regulator